MSDLRAVSYTHLPVEDLSDWRYEGVIFKKQDTPWNKENLSYYAPDVVRGTDGRYYLYYSVANTSITSVAVCDKPAGKYQYLGDVHFPDGRVYGSKPEDWFMFDPAVLVDDDGRVFLYVVSISELSSITNSPLISWPNCPLDFCPLPT